MPVYKNETLTVFPEKKSFRKVMITHSTTLNNILNYIDVVESELCERLESNKIDRGN